MQQQSLLDKGRRLGLAGGVVGGEAVLAALSEALTELAHGAWSELQLVGNPSRAIVLLQEVENALSEMGRKRSRHSRSLHGQNQVQKGSKE